MRKISPSLSGARSRQTGLVMPTGRLGALPAAPGFLALLAVLLRSGGLVAVAVGAAQAQDGEPPEVDNLRCVAATDLIAFLREAAEWSGGEAASYDYVLTLPDGRVVRSQMQSRHSRTLVVKHSGSYPEGKETRFKVKANYETPDGSEATSAETELVSYVGGKPATPTPTPTPTPAPTPNRTPTVTNAIADATIVHEGGTQSVSLSGVFSDADRMR